MDQILGRIIVNGTPNVSGDAFTTQGTNTGLYFGVYTGFNAFCLRLFPEDGVEARLKLSDAIAGFAQERVERQFFVFVLQGFVRGRWI
jgi:hypothetical protein